MQLIILLIACSFSNQVPQKYIFFESLLHFLSKTETAYNWIWLNVVLLEPIISGENQICIVHFLVLERI